MMSKFSLLVVFLLIVICCLIAVIYSQSKNMGKVLSRTTINRLVKNSIPQQIPASSNAKKKVSQTYYIDRRKGNNMSAGTSMDQAWKNFSVLKKISFFKGDKILLKRGEVWHQTLISPAGGTGKEPIIIDSYGSGRLPIIDVQNNHSTGISIYNSNISINNLRVQNSINNSISVAVTGGFNNIKLKNIEIFNAGNNGIGISKGGTDLEIIGCYIENAHNNGIYLGGSLENKLNTVIVSNCHIKKTSKNDGITIHEDSNGNTAGSNFLLKNNVSEMCAEQGFDITTGKNVLLVNNRSNQNKEGGVVVGHSAQNVTIEGHISTDEPTRETSAAINLQGYSGGVRLLKSIIKGNGYHLLVIGTNNAAIFNNNFIWNGGNAPVDITGEIENIHFINNIVHSKQKKMSRIRFLEASRPPNYKSFHFDHNIYYASGQDAVFYYNKKNYTFKKYQKAFKVDLHSLNTNPEFVNSPQDEYQLKNISPAIDKGCFLTHFISQSAGNKIVVNDVLFFYKNSDNHQTIMFKGIKEIFYVVDVDCKDYSITLDKKINLNQDNLIGLNYKKSALDIGAHEY